MPDIYWRNRARCRGVTDSRFFPDGERREAQQVGLLNETFCRTCPVAVECLASALRNRDTGIFAGTTTEQRRGLARIRNRAKCPRCSGTERIQMQEHDICTACGTSWRTERKVGQRSIDGHDERGSSAAR